MGLLGIVAWVACVGVLAAALGVAAATDLRCRIVPNGCVVAAAPDRRAWAFPTAACGDRRVLEPACPPQPSQREAP